LDDTSLNPLSNQFLVAMPNMVDPNFARTVTLICQHDENGALGVVINRTMEELSLGDVLRQLDVPGAAIDKFDANPVFCGGPVQSELGLVLHEGVGEWDSTLPVGSAMGLTTSRDVLEAIADNAGPDYSLLVLGYAGWGAGQLEREMIENAWLTVPADVDIIFRTPVEERWIEAARQLGVDIRTLAASAGHA
jgi:putative transcriptional regulator